jgi:hypothetical protein
MIIHGDKDEVVPQSSVNKLAQKLQKQKNIKIDYRIIEGSDHFFLDHLEPLNKQVNDYLDKMLSKAA